MKSDYVFKPRDLERCMKEIQIMIEDLDTYKDNIPVSLRSDNANIGIASPEARKLFREFLSNLYTHQLEILNGL